MRGLFMENNNLIIINEESIKDKIYEIRGQKVMLDFELAEIYGYTTKTFNQQVKNNIEKFDDDFRFQITIDELKDLVMSKKLTSRNNLFEGQKGGTRKLPYAFTEQGIYMLMTVLRGELATKQSKALIRLFKSMKDYIVESNNLITTNEILRLSRQVNQNTNNIKEIGKKLNIVMDYFSDPSKHKQFILLDNKRIEADLAYEQIYSSATKSVLLIDDYISVKTLQRLKACSKDIEITLITDNKSKNKVTNGDINDFMSDTGMDIKIIPSGGRFHDRYIVLDYKTESETIYHTGSSSKDAGNKISTITKLDDVSVYHPLLDELLNG